MDGKGTKCCWNIAENLNRLSRAHERYRRQTDDRQQTDGRVTANSERERSLKMAKKLKQMLYSNHETQALQTDDGPATAYSERELTFTFTKNLLNGNISPTSLKYGELQLTSSWDRFVSLGHLSYFQCVSCLGNVTARHSSSGRQRNFAALDRGHHQYLAGRPSCWALAHILFIKNVLIRITLSQNHCRGTLHSLTAVVVTNCAFNEKVTT